MKPRHYSFTDFLKDKCEDKGGYEGILDDDYEEAFERWLDNVDPGQIVEWGDAYGELMAMRCLEELEAKAPIS